MTTLGHVASSGMAPNVGQRLRGLLLGWVLPLVAVLVVLQLVVYRETSVPGFAPLQSSGTVTCAQRTPEDP